MAATAAVVAEEVDGGAGIADFVAGLAPTRSVDDRLQHCPAVTDGLQLAVLKYCRSAVGANELRAWAPWGWQSLKSRAIKPLMDVGLLVSDGDMYRAMCAPSDPFTSLVAVELKLRDWRRGLSQAGRYRLFAERSYIAVPSYLVSTQLVTEAEQHSVGVLSVQTSVEVSVVLDAPMAKALQSRRRALVAERVLAQIGVKLSVQAGSAIRGPARAPSATLPGRLPSPGSLGAGS